MDKSYQWFVLVISCLNLVVSGLTFDIWKRKIRPLLHHCLADKEEMKGLNDDQKNGRGI